MKLVSVPFSAGSLGKNSGCKFAPREILKDFPHQILQVDNFNVIKTNEILEKAEGDFFIGGDHSITYGLFKKMPENSGLIIFDAHPDCVNNFSPPTHEDFVKVLIEENIVKAKNVFLVGLRAIDPIEREYLDYKKINYILMKDFDKETTIKLKEFMERLDNIYLSLDIDVLDPEIAPGTGYLEPEGMKFEDLKNVLKEILNNKVKRIDLVEINPSKDIDDKTVNVGEEIVRYITASQFKEI